MLRKPVIVISMVLISLGIITASPAMQSSPILKLLPGDSGSHKDVDFLYLKPALAFQTILLPYSNNNHNNNYLYQHSYPSTTIANQLIEGWMGQCLSAATATASPFLSAKLDSITSPLSSVLSRHISDSDSHCNNQYLLPYLNQIDKMNLLLQCLPTATQSNDFITSINTNFGLALYCNSVIDATQLPLLIGGQQQSDHAMNQLSGSNTMCSDNVCQTTTCINNQCQTSSSGGITTPVGVQGEVNQEPDCMFMAQLTVLSCINNPTEVHMSNQFSSKMFGIQ
jgi:hypothetical protein